MSDFVFLIINISGQVRDHKQKVKSKKPITGLKISSMIAYIAIQDDPEPMEEGFADENEVNELEELRDLFSYAGQ